MDGSCNKCIKYLMFIFNFIFWLSGLALIIIGSYMKTRYGDYLSYGDGYKFLSVSVFVIVLGVIIFILGFLGCCGAIKENYCMITTFAILMSIILILQITAGVLGFVYKGKVETIVENTLKGAVQKYFDDSQPGAKTLLDWAQQKFECCGIKGPGDYKQPSTTSSYYCANSSGVASCYSDNKCGSGVQYGEGCEQSVIDIAKNNMLLCGAFAIAFALIQILGVTFACCLMKSVRNSYETV